MSLLKKLDLDKRLIFVIVIVCLSGLFCGWLIFGKSPELGSDPLPIVTIATPTQISAGAFYVAQQQNIFTKHRLDVSIQPFLLGKQALQSVLQDKADLAILADAPFMFAVMNGEKIAALTTIFGSRRTMAIVARKDRGITTAEDLNGKTVGTIFGTNAQFFIDTLLLTRAIPKSSVTIVDIKPEVLVETLVRGEVDAVTVWHPDLARLQQLMQDKIVTLYDEDIFVYRFILVGKQDYIDQHPAEVRQVLLAISEATQFIHEQPSQAKAILGQNLKMDPMLLHKAFDANDFYLTLDQTLLLALSDETRWAMKQGLVQGPIPNYLDYIRQEPLESVLPNAIKIIR
ncbi:MAG: NrtA/SsuA/CpmA family ABC transporter substrate-binding protein [Pseudomonadota bacterium]